MSESHSTSPMTARLRAWMGWLREFASTATSPTTPVTAARSTLGSSPTSSTNPTKAAPAIEICTRGPRVSARASSTMLVVTIATFDPLTALRCASPAPAYKSMFSPRVSPSTIAGRSCALPSPNLLIDAP